MANIVIPSADSTFAKGEIECHRCGKKMAVTVKIDPLWYRVLNAMGITINEQLL